MATQTRKCQLCRHLSLLLLVLLNGIVWADAEKEAYGLLGIQGSGYRPARGDTFFLLADTSFSASEPAVIRLEGPEEELGRYHGVDIQLYRVPDPLTFLSRQPNLHRIRLPGRYDGEGLANALNYVWDVWYKKSRLAWQRLFSADARTKATAQAPQLKQAPAHSYRTRFEDNPQFQPLPDYPLVARFRYPLSSAQPITPPPETKIAGASSEFFAPRPGNVRLPLGQLSPGLYLVEGLLGKYRAITPVLVANTAAITKTSGNQMLVWTADKKTGQPRPATQLLLTDGAGTLQRETTDAQGIARFDRPTPERSYLIARDQEGGIAIAENFYYDSEIHAPKLFAFTDRPLYRPGDTVHFKLVGRHYQDAQHSIPLTEGPVGVVALDPQGAPVATTTFTLDPEAGGDSSFQLPDDAHAGGYTLRLTYQKEPYAASFRVARYAKPHYDLQITFDRNLFKTGEPVTGTIRASYPGGQPVAALPLELGLRAQTLAMSDYEHRERGRFPVTLTQAKLTTDPAGRVHFELPPAAEPSRYTLRVAGNDGSSYRVSAIRELLVEAASPPWGVKAAKQLSQPGEIVPFALHRPPSREFSPPTTWETIRLEDQSVQSGRITAPDQVAIRFDQAGSYTVLLKDDQQRKSGATSHWVGGPGLKTTPDTITLLLDQESYRVGEQARLLISFPQPVSEALLTLERDQVHHHALLSRGGDWLTLNRVNATQWQAEIPITDRFSPNLTLSVLTIQEGAFRFQNKGIRVNPPAIALTLTPERPNYRPGEQVVVAMQTTVNGQPVAAHLAGGVVDEMVYALQPELAPDIRDFFGHPRRNQVRTLASLNFHAYDQAIPARDGESPARFHRPIKLLERPRRENIDTAAWFPRLQTGPDGRGQLEFLMPDSLTRWRITLRATTPDGRLGQQTATIVSEKPAYLKWGSPTRFREGDQVQGVLLAFNQGEKPLSAHLQLGETTLEQPVTLAPGVNHLPLPLTMTNDQLLDASLAVEKKVVDRLHTPLTVTPAAWPTVDSVTVPLSTPVTRVGLPKGTRSAQVVLAKGADAQWLRVAAELMDYPYGCVEQTASRLIPLTLVYRSLRTQSTDKGLVTSLRDRVANQRFRLAQLAGPESGFAWWGNQAQGSPFFSAYAYYADYQALQALGLAAPAGHWMKLLDIYRQGADSEPPLLQALALWLAAEMKLPVKTMARGVAERLLAEPVTRSDRQRGPGASRILDPDSAAKSRELTLALLHGIIPDNEAPDPGWGKVVAQAEEQLRGRKDWLSQSLALLVQSRRTKTPIDSGLVTTLLSRITESDPTIDRALALLFLDRAMGGTPIRSQEGPELKAPWIRKSNGLGGVAWHHPGSPGSEITLESEAPIPPGWVATVRTQGYSATIHPGPIALRRTLYRLAPALERPEPDYYSDEPQIETLFQATAVAPGEVLDATALYLDEVTLDPGQGHYRHGLLEVPLPPGGELDPFTWGMAVVGVAGTEEPVQLEETRAAMGDHSYAVPVAQLGGEEDRVVTTRHLVRFPVRGTLHLPPVRYFSMYNPEEQAMTPTGSTLVIQ